MITPSTGEVGFSEGLRITAHASISILLGPLRARLLDTKSPNEISVRALPIDGWRQYSLGKYTSSFGVFTVEVTAGVENRAEAVFLSHSHSFYDTPTPDDAERRCFHEGVIAVDLLGQQEFPWGHVLCRNASEPAQNWLVVIYSPFSAVPLRERECYRVLFEHAAPVGED